MRLQRPRPPAPPPLPDGIYTLSVVRLANPAHAEIAQLNVTEDDTSYLVKP